MKELDDGLEMEVVTFEVEDIITLSNGGSNENPPVGDDDGPEPFG